MDSFILAQAAQGPTASPLIPFALVLGIAYFMIIRPQANRQKEHGALLEGLKKGDRVVTNGGLVGSVASVKGDLVSLKLMDNVKVDVMKQSVSSLYQKPGQKQDKQ